MRYTGIKQDERVIVAEHSAFGITMYIELY